MDKFQNGFDFSGAQPLLSIITDALVCVKASADWRLGHDCLHPFSVLKKLDYDWRALKSGSANEPPEAVR